MPRSHSAAAAALTVTSDTDQIDNLIQGVTLNLTAADPTKTVTLTVANDPSTATQAVQNLVTAYNDFASTVNQLTSYDPQSGTAGTLLGNGPILNMQNQITNIVDSAVSGVNPLLNNLNALGISTNQDGTWTLDSAKLASVLGGQVTGVTANDVRNLFALAGQSNNAGVQFVTAGDKTTAGPVTVNITHAATQASLTATNALAASTTIDSTNNTLTFKVDGTLSSTVTLAAGTYTPAALANELQAEINGNRALSGRQVTVGLNGTTLVVTSGAYGSGSQVAVGTGTALSALGFTGNEAGTGQDVAGTFTVNGVTEPAVGSGQFLTGEATNAHTSGLEVRVALGSTQLGSGLTAQLQVTRGMASTLNNTLNTLLDPVTGTFQVIDQNYQANERNVQDEITQEQRLMAAKRQSLVVEFVNMETTLSQLKTAGSFISSQFSSLQPITTNSNTTNTRTLG